MDRFFLPDLDSALLSGPEAHHCLHVMRHGPNDRIVVFNGRGREATAVIESATKDTARLAYVTRADSPRPAWRLVLVQAVPKAKQMDGILQKATELGVTDIVPVISERSVVQLADDRAESKAAKWRQIVIEAGKQCGQNWLPDVHEPVSAKDYFRRAPSVDLSLIGSLQPGAVSFKQALADYEREHQRRPQSVAMLIGPEGDFTPAEMNLAFAQGCRPITLGPIVLRSETAALYSLSVLNHELQG
jgi:16S rRNA (uracil1498-N3)-methyltransferase